MKLTKNKYVEYALCPKKAWRELFSPIPQTRGETSRQKDAIKARLLARDYFGKGSCVESDRANPQKAPGIYAEYPLRYHDLECYCDLLRINNDGSVDIFEVKADNSIYDSNQIKPQLLEDVSFLYYVAKALGLTIRSINLMHLNPNYLYDGHNLIIKELFAYDDVTEIAKSRSQIVEDNIKGYFALDKKNPPACPLSKSCKLYGEDCVYLPSCKQEKGIPLSDSVYDLYGCDIEKKNKYFNSGIKTFKELHNSRFFDELSEFNKIMVKAILNNESIYIDKPLLKNFLDQIEFPIFFFDFETCLEAIPKYPNSNPNMQIPFQYSLHIMRKKESSLDKAINEHKEYLGNGKDDPRLDLANRLIKDLEKRGSIIAYHATFEKDVIKKLAETYPSLADDLNALRPRFIDLEDVFKQKKEIQKGVYKVNAKGHRKGEPKPEKVSVPSIYKKEIGSSTSIKYVLPAFYPNDKDLDYNSLEEVHRGDEAIEAYKKLGTLTDKKEIEELRKNMLRYCCLDTKAMVALYLKFVELAK